MNIQNARNNPFPGIRSFEEHEHNLFFGREQQVDDVVSVLYKTHFVALVGHSGSGKSSLIKAGVIPKIKEQNPNISTDWLVSVFRPGDKPIESFLNEFITIYNSLAKENDNKYLLVEDVIDSFLTDYNYLFDLLNKVDQKPWLLVIDQFEELFRIQNNGEFSADSILFIRFILAVIEQKVRKKDVYIILTMRSDFLDQCAEFPGLINVINKGLFIIPKMTRVSLEQAIIQPIEEGGGTISAELVKRLIDDLGDKQDQLPVMQHALMRAWDFIEENNSTPQHLDVVHYEAIGTINTALSVHAEELYMGFSPEKQLIVEKLFKSLIDIGQDNKGVRRPTSISNLLKLTEASEPDLFDVINEFRKVNVAFLMPLESTSLVPETIIDIAHESLMRVWVRLKQWTEEEVKSAELYLRLSKSAELYQQGQTGLWTNPELEIAVKWIKKEKPNESWAERYDLNFERTIEFLHFCKKESDFKIRSKEEKHKRELKRARRVVVFLSLASVVSLLFFIISLVLKFDADESREQALFKEKRAIEESFNAKNATHEAVAQKRIAEQQQEIAKEQKEITEEQRKYAVFQENIAKESELKAKTAERDALMAEKDAKDSEVKAKESEKEARIAEREAQQSEKNTRRLHILAIARSLASQSQRIVKTNNELARLFAKQAYNFTLENNGELADPLLFNALSESSETINKLKGSTDLTREVCINKYGSIFSAGDDGMVYVWNAEDPTSDPQNLHTKNSVANGIRCIDTYGHSLIAGTNDGSLLYWEDISAEEKPIVIKAHTGILLKVKFLSDNKIITLGNDAFLKIWNVQNFSNVLFNEKQVSQIKDVDLNMTKDKFVVALENGLLEIFNVQTNALESTIQTHCELRAVAFDPLSENIATGDASGRISFWNITTKTKQNKEFSDHKSAITALDFSPDKTHLVSSSYDHTMRIWNLNTTIINPVVLEMHKSWVMDVKYNETGDYIVSSGIKGVFKTVVNLDRLADTVCDKVTHNLSLDDWNEYVGIDIPYEKTCGDISK